MSPIDPPRADNFNRETDRQPVQATLQPSIERRELVRHNEMRRRHNNSFFALLFERPARRRYYRQLNQNATNLVRRLSQSRLFLNSSRSQNANYRNSYVNTRSNSRPEPDQRQPAEIVDHENLSTSEDEDFDSTTPNDHNLATSISLPSLNFDNNNEHLFSPSAPSVGICASENDLTLSRLETPPPSYTEIIHIST